MRKGQRMLKHIVRGVGAWVAALVILGILPASPVRAQQLDQGLRGYEIAANQGIPLNLRGKDWELVGLGSYLVNTTGCNDCHTHPNWANNESPYVLSQQPGQINTPEYMAGGRIFGPVANPVAISANIT